MSMSMQTNRKMIQKCSLDAGCGNGDLSHKAAYERGIRTLGLTMSDDEVLVNKRRGLQAIRHSFKHLKGYFKPNQFDAIVSNGSTEHLISIEDALGGDRAVVIKQQLQEYWHVLKPGGYLCFTCIHVRMETDPDPNLVAQDAWNHDLESDLWHFSVLCEFYSGYYPVGDMMIDIAQEIGYTLIRKDETLDDYLQTSLVWRKKMTAALNSFTGFFWCLYIWLFVLVTDPIYSWYCLAYHYGCTWTWQFEQRYVKNGTILPSACTHYTIALRKPMTK
eukprot:360013_1